MPRVTTKPPNPLAVRLQEDDLKWLRARKASTGESVNSMISEAVGQYRRRHLAAAREAVRRAAADR